MTNLITSELLNKTLLEFATNIKDVATDAVSFSKEQVPLVVQELLRYEFYNSLFFSILFLCIAIYVFRYLYKTKDDYVSGDGYPARFLCILLASAIFSSSLVFANNAMKIKLAPRVYILEYVKRIVSE